MITEENKFFQDFQQQIPYLKLYQDLEKDQQDILKVFYKKASTSLPSILNGRNQQFTERYLDPDQMTRVLRAREFEQTKAFEMWQRWVQWRVNFRVDNINPIEIQHNIKSGICFWHGYDQQGDPALIVRVKFYLPGAVPIENTVRFASFLMEKGIELSEKRSGKVSVIWDREGFSMKNFDQGFIQLIQQTMTMFQDNYAERLQRVFIIHPSWFLQIGMSIISAFLSQKTLEKIKILNEIEMLKEYYDDRELLQIHGGTSPFQYDPSIVIKQGCMKYQANQTKYGILRNESIITDREQYFSIDNNQDQFFDLGQNTQQEIFFKNQEFNTDTDIFYDVGTREFNIVYENQSVPEKGCCCSNSTTCNIF